MKTIEFLKSEVKKKCEETAKQYELSVKEIFFGEKVLMDWKEPYLGVTFVDGYVIYCDEKTPDGYEPESIGTQFTCAFKTPKGYISSKKIGVPVKDISDVTLEEAALLLEFNTDAIKNTYDPFWHENEARRRNAAAWNFIASNYLQDDCR